MTDATLFDLDHFAAIVGAANCLNGSATDRYRVDTRGIIKRSVVAVLRPASTTQVQAIVRACAAANIAIVSQGGNTGQCGAAQPASTRPSIIVSMERMRAIESVNAEGGAIVAEAGCSIEALQQAANDANQRLGMDWGARGTATIGGAVSTNAGGNNVLRYGSTREQILGIEAVMANGDVFNGLRALRKNNAGYDLKQLLIGAEGTLGIITRVVVRLHSAAAMEHSAMVALCSINHLPALLAAARLHGGQDLNAFELVPSFGVRAVLERHPDIRQPIDSDAEWYVLVRFAGDAASAERLQRCVEAAFEAGLIDDGMIAQSDQQSENLWRLRDSLPPTRLFGGGAMKFDVAVPLDRLVDYIGGLERCADAVLPGAWVYIFGHAGDGSLHVSVWPGKASQSDFDAQRQAMVAAIDQYTWSLGGTIAAEHGVGQDLVSRISGQRDPVETAMMQRIKTALDPHHLFNPGVLLPVDDSPR
ncbi:FAD-binding oxidoreductase [Gammaproteobacteria bacterium]|nr:FAD-binding oxidoreductase [Gammaproteobacteria bacterium]